MRRFKPAHLCVAAAILLAGIFLSVPAHAQATGGGERITGFDDQVSIKPDATIDVTEIINVIAAGNQIKHGIYRDFPTHYSDKEGNDVDVGFHVVDVWRDNQMIPYSVQPQANGQRVYMGSQSAMVAPGAHTYVLHYHTDHQLGYFKDYDELYWNVTGNGWLFPIDRVTATIRLPPGAKLIQQSGYTGYQGGQGHDYRFAQDAGGAMVFATTRPLNPQEGLTVAVAWPKGLVAQPAPLHRFDRGMIRKILADAFGALIFYYIAVWFLYGRMPRKGPIIPLFAAPAGFSPGEVNYLYKKAGRDDKTAFSASLVNMAVKGYLKINHTRRDLLKEVPQLATMQGLAGSIAGMAERMVGMSKTFMLQKNAAPSAPLSTEEQIIASHTVDAGADFALDPSNRLILAQIFREYENDLKQRYGNVYYNYNYTYIMIGAGLSVLVAAISFFAALLPLVIFGLIVVNAIFAKLLKTPTVQGRKILDQIEGFKMYLGTAEKNRLNMMTPPMLTPEIFEKFLPYAMALGVQNNWGKQFEAQIAKGLYTDYRPNWYAGEAWNAGNIAGFTSSFSTEFAGAIQSSVTPPGSSSGSGGGGSSGGGGGGGGGGGF